MAPRKRISTLKIFDRQPDDEFSQEPYIPSYENEGPESDKWDSETESFKDAKQRADKANSEAAKKLEQFVNETIDGADKQDGDGKPQPADGKTQDKQDSPAESLFNKAVREVLDADQVATMPWTQAAVSEALRPVMEEIEKVRANPLSDTEQRFTVRIQVNEQPPIDFEEQVHPVTPDLTRRMAARIDTMLVGPTGCGKTHAFYQACKALGMRGASLSLSAGISESALCGRRLPGADGAFIFCGTQFVDFAENGGAFLLDEADAGDANVLLAPNQLMANGILPLPNRLEMPYAKRHPDFVIVMACNTYGHGADRMYVGRNQLDAATLDRFAGSVLDMDYDEKMERKLVSEATFKLFAHARKQARAAKLRRAVSTRAMLNADRLLAIGYTLPQVWERYTAGWSPDEISKVNAGSPLTR